MTMKKMTDKKTILLAVMMFTVVSSGIFMSVLINKLEADADRSRELKVFEEAVTIVREKYVEDVEPSKLINGAIQGMIGSLDRHSDLAVSEKNVDTPAETRGTFIGRLLGAAEADVDKHKGIRLFEETLATVTRNYAANGTSDIRSKDLVYSAIQGMMGSLDPHSEFMTPEQYEEMQKDAKGEFGGIGIKLDIEEGMLAVVDVLDGTPAFRAGIREGDRIIRIDDQSTEKMSLQKAIDKTRGMPSTAVKLAILRRGWKNAQDVSVSRETIRISSVKSELLGDGIGYIKIHQFQKQTASDFSAALSRLMQGGMKSLIIDLRNNPGGLLHSAVDVASRFVPSGKLVVYTQNRSGNRKEYRSRESTQHLSVPLVVIVNEGSASASEILTGALKDWGRATVVGTTTYGKGSVQTVVSLDDGSALKITTARYYTPKGTSIQTTGITPDLVVKPRAAGKDFKGHLADKGPARTATSKGVSTMTIEHKEDAQMLKAVNLLRSRTPGNSGSASAHSRNMLRTQSTSLPQGVGNA
jgi:carboxyl-terminal processing protease